MIKITHVEDDPDIREITSLALDLTGDFCLTQFASGEDALAKVQDTPPDVLLLDMMMPGMTGGQTLERIRELPDLAQIPAIFMTARSHHDMLQELGKHGPIGVIGKPVDPLKLGDQIKEVMARITGAAA